MKVISVLVGLLAISISMPIWFYLLYQILVRVEASELMFFLYWVYIPVTMLAHVVAKLSEQKVDAN